MTTVMTLGLDLVAASLTCAYLGRLLTGRGSGSDAGSIEKRSLLNQRVGRPVRVASRS